MRRAKGRPELLDGPLDDRDLLEGNLRDLRRINRFLGGAALSSAMLGRLLDGDASEAAIVDVGTGAADIPLALLASARRAGRRLSIVGVDSRPEVLAAARAIEPALSAPDAPGLAVADGRCLPWPDRHFDVAHASLVLHHLDPPDAVTFLAELSRVSRRGVIVNDLARSASWWALAVVGSRILTRNPLTRHDAPLSVRRAYTVGEVRRLLAAAGLRTIDVRNGLLGHRYAIAAVPTVAHAATGAAGTRI